MNEVDDRLAGDPVWELFAPPPAQPARPILSVHPSVRWGVIGGLIPGLWSISPVLAVLAGCTLAGAGDFFKGGQLARTVPDKAGGKILARFAYAWGAWKFAAVAFLMIFVCVAVLAPGKRGGEVPAVFPITMFLWAGGFIASAALTASGLFSAYRSGMRVWVGEGVNRARLLLLGMLIVAFTLAVLVPLCVWLSVHFSLRSPGPDEGLYILLPVFGCLLVGPFWCLWILDRISPHIIADCPSKFGPKVPTVGKWSSIASALLLIPVLLPTGAMADPPATGPLKRLESNPRYFTDGSNRAVLLVGSHNWHNFQDNGHRISTSDDPPPVFDYDGYLDFLTRHGHNFFRLWRWEAPKWSDAQPAAVIKYCQPHPWPRSGPGAAADGKPKFDLDSFDPAYFERLRERIKKASDRGIYVSIMLFEGWELQFTDAWKYHPFRGPNNINNVDADTSGRGLLYNELRDDPRGKKALALQEAYARKVVDSVNDLDNVLYEVCNEAGVYSTKWQYHLIDFIHRYEASLPKQHPVGMTFEYPGATNKILFDSPADWVSPNPGSADENYKERPSPRSMGKVIVNDTDHLWGHTGGDSIWVWKSFTRGLNILFMEELLPSPTWQDSARAAMGQVREFSQKIDLAHMIPTPELSGTGYILAARGREYLAFQDGSLGEFWIDLSGAEGSLDAEWYDINNSKTIAAKPVRGGGRRVFTTPFPGPAAVHLKRASS
jgi:hypothetical protein